MNEDGHTSSIKDKILSIEVKPGWREGTKIIFSKEGDQVYYTLLYCIHYSVRLCPIFRRLKISVHFLYFMQHFLVYMSSALASS